MKYIVRFALYFCDEFDTNCANIYDILVEEARPSLAIKIGKVIVEEEAATYYWPGEIKFISLTDENGSVYVLSNDRLILLPKEDHDKLPKKFCENETFFVVGIDRIPKMYFPEPH